MKNYLIIFLLIASVGCKNTSKEENKEPIRVGQIQKSSELEESISRGASVYRNFCASCHLASGEGITGVFPPLKDSDWFTEKRMETIHAVKFGLNGPIEVRGKSYDNLMPDLGLTDRETADVLNYIFNSWGNTVEQPVTEEEVAAIKN